MSAREEHVPVMLDRVCAMLAPALEQPGSIYVDCTTGMGGHAEAMLERCPNARLVGLDRDADAIAVAREHLARFGDRVQIVHAVYDELPEVLAGLGIPAVHAVLADLGLSSLQIDRRERGFAYSVDAPLDMRMDARAGKTAADIVNNYDARALARIFAEYGEEKFASRIAQGIVAARAAAPLTRSGELVEVITQALPAAARFAGGHPGKRVFQALRIEVNDELVALESMVPSAMKALALGGRFAVLSYHSLEDRLVKKNFAAGAADRAPRGLPVIPEGMGPQFQLLTRGAEKPTAAEIAQNSRAGSAKFRAIERIAA